MTLRPSKPKRSKPKRAKPRRVPLYGIWSKHAGRFLYERITTDRAWLANELRVCNFAMIDRPFSIRRIAFVKERA